jgi:drug/metabolite transporter (DMT)-like permease
VGGAFGLVAGGIYSVAAYVGVAIPSSFTGGVRFDRTFAVFAGIGASFLLFGIFQLVAGLQVMRRRRRGWRLGILASFFGMVLGLFYMYVSESYMGAAVAAILAYGLIGWILAINRRLFSNGSKRDADEKSSRESAQGPPATS